jgi:hypothetical protein
MEMYTAREDTRAESGEDDIEYDNERMRVMISVAEDEMENARYKLDHEDVTYDFEVSWDDWNEAVEARYKITIDFDFKFANFMGSPNLGKGSEEELRKAMDRVPPLAAVRDIAETAYEESDAYNYDIAVSFSSDLVDVRMGQGTMPVVRIQMYDEDITHDPDNFAYNIASEFEYITDRHEEIYRTIEEALKEDGWLIETDLDKLKVDPENVKKLGEDSFENFSISKDDGAIDATAIFELEGYPVAGERTMTTDFGDTRMMYTKGPQFVDIMRSDSPNWKMYKARAILPPERRKRVMSAIKKEITDAAKAASMQPDLPMADLPASDNKSMKGADMLTPSIDNLVIFMKQKYKPEGRDPYGKKDEPLYSGTGGIVFQFEPGITKEQIQTNLRFIKYFDNNMEPVRVALQKEWDDMLSKYEKEIPLRQKEEETNESIGKILRSMIKDHLRKG